MSKTERTFALTLLLLSVGFLILEIINGRIHFWDFQVYYGAAEDFIQGNSPYESNYGVDSGYYKYSPFVLILVAPFTVLPYSIASVIFFFIISVATIYLIINIFRFLNLSISIEQKWWAVPLWLMAILIAAHLVRELELGNVNLLLLLLFFSAFIQINKKKILLAGILIAIGILVKPHFIILIPLLFLKGRWKLLTILFASLMIFSCLPSIFVGWQANEILHTEWFETMAKHNQSLIESPNTIYGLTNNLLNYIGITIGDRLIIGILGLCALGVFGMVIFNSKFSSKNTYPKNYLEYFLLIALIPSLTHTDTEHFLWTLPILGLLIFSIIDKTEGKLRLFWLFILIVVAFPWYMNSPDILGQETAVWFEKGGLIGLSNLLIISMGIFFFYRKVPLSSK